MQVKLLVARATMSESQERNQVIDVPEAEAIRMIAAGQAEAVRSVKPEKAVKRSKAEKATK